MDRKTDHPDLNPRFLQPDGWRWHNFTNPQGRTLRFGTVSPRDKIPDAVVVCLPGLSEFGEKYFELAHDMLDRNLAFWVLDWQGQGKSHRHLNNKHRRYSTGFDDDVADLHFFLNEYVKHAAVQPDVGRIPLVMLAHSMGGNIGLRYLSHHQDMFACAAFSAPMLGIQALNIMPQRVHLLLTGLFNEIAGTQYVFGGKDWSPVERDDPKRNIFSSHPGRAAIHNAWSRFDPALQVGNVTFRWLYEAARSCALLQQKNILEDIHTPCFLACAQNEKLVDNRATHKAAARMPHAKVMDLQESLHEILMERDPIRNAFLNGFDELLQHNKIRTQRTPF
ncbi:alpha/beta fold hydrolase [Micavibrio aeruginosavorus]|uniref:Alpha/beta hydrolase fold family protein n=1 Tax=Micavibrio aeruginosavorus (strain ARL-13) TaxID=856793 RepID=G2KMA0_MICAA|nr:alpha/beta hydrolase [Micavibrio aeruginosavorus]AEP10194.1 alpha/beta hydrolase fold family protein [Micavibrio aeruginosavorus ARL-13]